MKKYNLSKRDFYPALAGGVVGFIGWATGENPMSIGMMTAEGVCLYRIVTDQIIGIYRDGKKLENDFQNPYLSHDEVLKIEKIDAIRKKEWLRSTVLGIAAGIVGIVLERIDPQGASIVGNYMAKGFAVGYTVGYGEEMVEKLREPMKDARKWMRRNKIEDAEDLQRWVKKHMEKSSPENMQKICGFPQKVISGKKKSRLDRFLNFGV